MIPALPDGATVDSITIASARLRGLDTYRRAREIFYRRRMGERQNSFGRFAEVLSSSMLADKIAPHDILKRHSAWPVYAALMPSTTAHEWMVDTLKGGQAQTLRRFRSLSGKLCAERWRSCHACALEHIQDFGCAHWLVLHQLPGVRHCYAHGVSLSHACGGCGAPVGGPTLLTLPTDPCAACGSFKRAQFDVRTSPGQAALYDLYRDLLSGSKNDLSIDARASTARRLIGRLPHAAQATALKEEFLEAFGVRSAAQLSEVLEVSISDEMLGRAMGGDFICPQTLQLAFCAWFMRPDRLQDHSGDDLFNSPVANDTGVAALFLEADKRGLPRAAILGILDLKSAHALEKARLCTKYRWFAFVATLPSELRVLLESFGVPLRVRTSSKPRPPKCENPRDFYREQILASLPSSRAELYITSRDAIRWSVKHDLEWLDVVCPRKNGRVKH